MNTATSTEVLNIFLDFENHLCVGYEQWHMLVVKINWIYLFIVFIFAYLFFKKKHFKLDSFQVGLSENFSCSIVCDYTVQEIAYKIWIELITRKVAISIEEDDVIIEIYDSWYNAFGEIRNLLKDVNGRNLKNASGLIEFTTKVLNEGLRPHLTKWQAKFRNWYAIEVEKSKDKEKTPQEIQKNYKNYENLISDLKDANQIMINFAVELEKIAFDKK